MGAAALVVALAPPGTAAASATADDGQATDGPGTLSHFDLARKDCVGTARNRQSKVWYTVADGVLSDVYEPTVDNTNVHTLQYVVTDGHSFTDLQARDLDYTVAADRSGMVCTVTATSRAHGYQLVTTYLTDPARDSVVMHTRLRAVPGSRTDVSDLAVYARLDAIVNGNGGGGPANGGADTGHVSADGTPVVSDENTVTEAANRDYAVPTAMALASPAAGPATVGYAGQASDGLAQLDADHRITDPHTSAPDGHVVVTQRLRPARSNGSFTLALGFGRTPQRAVATAHASTAEPFARTRAEYQRTWRRYDAGLDGLPEGTDPTDAATYWRGVNVLKASEDKTFPGAIVASLASPWGQAVSAGGLPGGKPVYFGSYREVFARDLYEAATGLLAAGDRATARVATRFLFQRQQQPGGQMPRNSLLNGEPAPDTGGLQLDETAYPILMAWRTGLAGDHDLYADHIRPAADFLVAHGPAYGNERWEEQSGYSPSTIAAEIAGLTAAAHIAARQEDPAHARLYQAVADAFQRGVKDWTLADDGPYSDAPYFLRLSKNGDPDSAWTYNLGNGSIDADQRVVVDGGFQELVRLGELAVDDPDVTNSLRVVDAQIAASTPTGTGYHRYGTGAEGTEDGYGDCWTPDPTSCPRDGEPWPTTNHGSGQLWPVLSGERAETALAAGDLALARRQLAFMQRSASGIGLVPEQVWENPDLPASPYGADPATASIGFADGHAAGSASPLSWAQAQAVRLVRDLAAGRITDRPAIMTERYVDQAPPSAVPVTITSPGDGTQASGTLTVAGTSTPGARVDVTAIGTDTPGSATASITAAPDGSWSVRVPVAFGADAITAAATTATGTGTDRIHVVGDLTGGTTVLDTADPTGDDDGPGTYRYPTAQDFAAGSYDITRFQVLRKDDTVYLRTTLRTLVPTFGSPMGAQLLDVYLRDPNAPTTSTAAAFPARNYGIAPGDAWSQRIEVQGFAAPVWRDATGEQVGTVTGVVASPTSRTITVALPASELGDVGSGWTFAVVLTGQDGYSSDQARGFAATPQPYLFGVCAPDGISPICAADPGTVPKAVDVITPPDVSQSEELDPTRGPVRIRAVTAP